MSIKTRDLDKLPENSGKRIVIKRLNLPVLPIGKDSKNLLKRYS